MKRKNNNPLFLAIITLSLFGVLSTFTSANATPSNTNHATRTVDFNGDGKSDITLFDTTIARLFTYDLFQGTFNQYDPGSPADRQVIGDYDGDGFSDIAVCYENLKTGAKTWRISYSTYGPKGDIIWGSRGDIPVPADYDGDGITDLAVFRPFGAVWYIRLSRSKKFRTEQLGNAFDNLVPADYDGDGQADIAVMSPSQNEWQVHFSSDNSVQIISWEIKSEMCDVMVPADYDGDNRADFAVYRKNGGLWIVLESLTGTYRFAQFGNGVYTGAPTQAEVTDANLDLPMPGDFDGDGIVDIAVWNRKSREVNVLPSSSSIMTSVPVGTETSIPVSLSIVSGFQDIDTLTFQN